MRKLENAFVGEQWLSIPGFPRYEVSSHGRVRRIVSSSQGPAGSILPGGIDEDGYRHTTLTNSAGKTTFKTSKLVLSTFEGPAPEGYVVHHLDKDKSNDWLYNLKYIECMTHRIAHAKSTRSSRKEALRHSAAVKSSRRKLGLA